MKKKQISNVELLEDDFTDAKDYGFSNTVICVNEVESDEGFNADGRTFIECNDMKSLSLEELFTKITKQEYTNEGGLIGNGNLNNLWNYIQAIQEKLEERRIESIAIALNEVYHSKKRSEPDYFEDVEKYKPDLLFDFILFQLSKLAPKNVILELTAEKSLLFTIQQYPDITIYYEVYFECVDEEPQIVFTVYRNKKCIATGEGNSASAFLSLKGILSKLAN